MKINSNSFKTVNGIKTNVKLLEKVQEYVDVIEYLQESFNVNEPWYRGVSHAKHELIPKVHRDRLWDIHENYEWWIFTTFANKARQFIPNYNSYTDWKWYFTMQHYGLPTRLLDWTEASLVALYFAVKNPNDTYIPSVYILDPYWLDEVTNNKKTGEGLTYSTDETNISEEHEKLLCSYLELDEKRPCFPICINPPVIDNRIYTQKSVFTMHGKWNNPFKIIIRNNKNARVAKIRFSTKSAKYIKQQLYAMGITEGTLFPGLEGLSQDLKWQFGIE